MPTDRQMAKSKPIPRGSFELPDKPIVYELIGLGLMALGILLFLAPYFKSTVPNSLHHGLQWLFGAMGSYGIAVGIFLLGLYTIVRLSQLELSATALGMGIIFLVAISMMPVMAHSHSFAAQPGGFIGCGIAMALNKVLGKLSLVVLIAVGLGGIALMTDLPLWQLLCWPVKAIYLAGRWVFRPLAFALSANREAARVARIEKMQHSEPRRRNRPEPVEEDDLPRQDVPPLSLPQPEPSAAALRRMRNTAGSDSPEQLRFEEVVPDEERTEPIEYQDAAADKPARAEKKAKPEAQESLASVAVNNNRQYVLPPTELLIATSKGNRTVKDDTKEKTVILEETLKSFGIDAKVVEVLHGPRVTRFEIVPPPGIRINRITNLADNIALSLSALDVRVEAPVPGKGVVGIEVPNRELVMVDLREMVESDPFVRNKSAITFALGRDIAGHPRCADMARMPHLLIAGATNSGKSVCINSLICSILMRATPQQVKFLMVDPKRVELTLYQSIPHLVAPVAHDAKHAAGLLRWAIREMEERYDMFSKKLVRNITGFNEQSRMEGLEELPFILIIIDELADLMMQAAAEFEASICRIAQLSRATGIHLVVATQRPSVNVITGTIKANIPSRIAFAVASQVDSRTILDMNGAERLVGQGDMLYLPVDASKPVRIQGAYVSEEEINRIVAHVKEQGKPHFTDEIVAIEEEALHADDEEGEYSAEPEDELFARSLDFIRTTNYASTSMLQRKFRIGYTRAARIMDLFEERGYVGPGQGSKPREVIFAPSTSVTGLRGGDEEEEEEIEEE